MIAGSYNWSSRNEERKESFIYLFVYLFNDALDTFFLTVIWRQNIWTIQIAREKIRCRHYMSFYMHHPTDKVVDTMAFVTPVVEH